MKENNLNFVLPEIHRYLGYVELLLSISELSRVRIRN
jgi:hypothetical protein